MSEPITVGQFFKEYNPEQFYAIHWSKAKATATVYLKGGERVEVIPDPEDGQAVKMNYGRMQEFYRDMYKQTGITEPKNHIANLERNAPSETFAVRVSNSKADVPSIEEEYFIRLSEISGNHWNAPGQLVITIPHEDDMVLAMEKDAKAALEMAARTARAGRRYDDEMSKAHRENIMGTIGR